MADPAPNHPPTTADDPDAAHRDAQRRMVAALFRQQPHPALRRPLPALPPYADDAFALERALATRRRLYGGDDDAVDPFATVARGTPLPPRGPTRSLWPCAPQPCSANNSSARPPFLQGGLLAASAGATTTDHRDQALANVLTDAPDRFWSSTGEAVTLPEFPWGAASEERLTFVLASCGGGANGAAAALTGGVTIRAYRATFQPGHPVYPPLKVQIWLGSSLASLKPAGPWLPFWPSAAAQSFPVAAASAAGGGARVLQVRLRGRPQWQLEDLRFYVALQYCGASGVLLPPATALPSPAARNASAAAFGGADAELPPLLRWWGWQGRGFCSAASPALLDRTGGRAQADGGFWREGWRQRGGEDEGMEEEREEDAAGAPPPRSAAAAAPLQGALVVDASLAPYWPVGPAPPRRPRAVRVLLASLFAIYGRGGEEEEEDEDDDEEEEEGARADARAAGAWAKAAAVAAAAAGG
jgi:hypothetical protein